MRSPAGLVAQLVLESQQRMSMTVTGSGLLASGPAALQSSNQRFDVTIAPYAVLPDAAFTVSKLSAPYHRHPAVFHQLKVTQPLLKNSARHYSSCHAAGAPAAEASSSDVCLEAHGLDQPQQPPPW